MGKNKRLQPERAEYKRRSQGQEIWRNYRRNFSGMLGLFLILLVIGIGIWGNIHYDYDAEIVNMNFVEVASENISSSL